MREKRDFAQGVLNHMRDNGAITDWESAGDANRHDYRVALTNGRTAIIELKGCLDGNNTNIFERPPHAHEFVIWSVCTNPGADPRHNAWSGIHTRLSAEIISRNQQVDGLIVWDMVCGTVGRPCPKMSAQTAVTEVGTFLLPPPCIYLMPATVPHPRNNPHPKAQGIDDVQILNAFHTCFGGRNEDLNQVEFEVHYRDADIVRSTTVSRAGEVVHTSSPTPIRRS
jgi:hypothetical protein